MLYCNSLTNLITFCVGGGPVWKSGARTSSNSGCKKFKYFHKGSQYLNLFGGTSKKNHPVAGPCKHNCTRLKTFNCFPRFGGRRLQTWEDVATRFGCQASHYLRFSVDQLRYVSQLIQVSNFEIQFNSDLRFLRCWGSKPTGWQGWRPCPYTSTAWQPVLGM